MIDPLRIILVRPEDANLEIVTVEHELSQLQSLVGGNLKALGLAGRIGTADFDRYQRGIDLWCNEAGDELPYNRILGPFLVLDDTGLRAMVGPYLIRGTFFVAAHENRRAVSLTDNEVAHWTAILAEAHLVTRQGV